MLAEKSARWARQADCRQKSDSIEWGCERESWAGNSGRERVVLSGHSIVKDKAPTGQTKEHVVHRRTMAAVVRGQSCFRAIASGAETARGRQRRLAEARPVVVVVVVEVVEEEEEPVQQRHPLKPQLLRSWPRTGPSTRAESGEREFEKVA